MNAELALRFRPMSAPTSRRGLVRGHPSVVSVRGSSTWAWPRTTGVTEIDGDRCNLYGSLTLLEAQSDRVLGNRFQRAWDVSWSLG